MAFSRVQWTTEAVTALIDKVRAIPVLWNSEHPQYKKKTLRRQLYGKVALELQGLFPDIEGINAENAMQKFSMLKSSFRREEVKIKSQKNDSGSYLTRWSLFKKLSFLSESTNYEANLKYDNHSPPPHGTNYEANLKFTNHSSPSSGNNHITCLGQTSGHGFEVVGQGRVISHRPIKAETGATALEELACGGESNKGTDEVNTEYCSDQSTTASPPSSPLPPPLPLSITLGTGGVQPGEGASTDCGVSYSHPTTGFGRPLPRKRKRSIIHQENNNFNSDTFGFLKAAVMAQQAAENMTVAKAAGNVVESVLRDIPLYRQLEVFNNIIALLRKEIRDERCEDSS
ncbi:hypothetical protein Pcinc_011313 [Petrolisthes cinctipes]|uniref:MADF domain-containing protein n=1 Tax=Petrolisthes cinctipes TaxID=88211 RepID=A0AAE1KWH2_PETCI|nr:hypothetical protein Pcinc_011313 [Petrolisthes cinctipes]